MMGGRESRLGWLSKRIPSELAAVRSTGRSMFAGGEALDCQPSSPFAAKPGGLPAEGGAEAVATGRESVLLRASESEREVRWRGGRQPWSGMDEGSGVVNRSLPATAKGSVCRAEGAVVERVLSVALAGTTPICTGTSRPAAGCRDAWCDSGSSDCCTSPAEPW